MAHNVNLCITRKLCSVREMSSLLIKTRKRRYITQQNSIHTRIIPKPRNKLIMKLCNVKKVVNVLHNLRHL